MSKFNPATLSPQTGCQFVPPAHISYERIKGLETYLRLTVPTRFKGRVSRTFYFEFPTPRERDLFLKELEAMLARRGNQAQRINY